MASDKTPKGKGGIYKKLEGEALSVDQVPVMDPTGTWELYSAGSQGGQGTGKPSLRITPYGAKVIRYYVAQGLPFDLIAERIGMELAQMKSCINRQPDVKQAIAAAKAEGEFEIRACLMGMAKRGNVIAAIYLSKALFGWRDNDAPPETKPNLQIFINAPMSTDDYKRLREEGVNPLQLPGPKLDEPEPLLTEGESVPE